MKTLGYIYGTIIRAMSNEITAEQALDLIKAVLSEQGQEILHGHITPHKSRKEA